MSNWSDQGGYPVKNAIALSTVDRMGFPLGTYGPTTGPDLGGVPETRDPYWRYVVVMAHANGPDGSTNIINSSGPGVAGAFLLTAGNTAAIDGGNSVFGGGSILFNGVSNSFVRNNTASPYLAFGTDDFTIECRINIAGANGILQTIYDGRDAADGAFPRLVSSTTLPITITYNVNTTDVITSSNLTPLTWYALAISRNAGITRMFINGQPQTTEYTDTTNYPSAKLSWGLGRIGSHPLSGWADEYRITKGIGRYIGPYIPNQGPFADH